MSERGRLSFDGAVEPGLGFVERVARERDALAAKSRCGDRDEQALDGLDAGGQVVDAAIDDLPARKTQLGERFGAEALARPAAEGRPAGHSRTIVRGHGSCAGVAAPLAVRAKSLPDLGRKLHA